MSYKQSGNIVKRNSQVWAGNLTPFNKAIKTRKVIASMSESLVNLCRMPKETSVIGRFNALAGDVKCRNSRIQLIAQELLQLWSKLNFPVIAVTSVERKLKKLLTRHDTFLKFPKNKDEVETFSSLFDITSTDGKWLSSQDKEMYYRQVESDGRVGYTTGKLLPVHPSKSVKSVSSQSVSMAVDGSNSSTTSSEDDESDNCSSDSYEPPPKNTKRRKHSTGNAMNLVKHTNLSTRKAAVVCQRLSQDGIQIPTPTQAGIYKAAFRESDRMKMRMKESLKADEWALHFDGKHIDGKERQVIVVKNDEKEVRLGVLTVDNCRAQTIADGIIDTLNYYELWTAIKMIICDTTAVNTGRQNGVVAILKRHFVSLNLPSPQYVGCQHHVLDRVLKHVMDELLGSETRSPNIQYEFVVEIVDNYDALQKKFIQSDNPKVDVPNIGWRDDMQFLLELGHACRYYFNHGIFPFIPFKGLPNLSNARWNSRAILALLAYILLPHQRVEKMTLICKFICGTWMDLWFSDQKYKPNSYEELREAVKNYGKAKTCVERHWCREASTIDTQRSNICAERSIHLLQSLSCTRPDTLNSRFILTNTHF